MTRKTRKTTRNVGGVKCFLGWAFSRSHGLVIPSSRRPVVLLARLPVILRRSQPFSVIPSQSRATQSFPVVPWSRSLVVSQKKDSCLLSFSC